MTPLTNDVNACVSVGAANTGRATATSGFHLLVGMMTVERAGRSRQRDPFLDCLKGLAILTVVAGHTFQGATRDFDDFWPFRIIYSFHMPMFMFVSGMVASIFVAKVNDAQFAPYHVRMTMLFKDIGIRASRLLVPFIAWAIVKYFLADNQTLSLAGWIWKVVHFPDNGLWFLDILFQVSVILVGCTMLTMTVSTCLHLLAIRGWQDWRVKLVVLAASGWLGQHALVTYPDIFGLYLTKILFPYFYLGLMFQELMPRGLPGISRIIPYVVFAVFAPFWYRLQPSPLLQNLPDFIDPTAADTVYRYIVALAGTLVLVDLARVAARRPKSLLLVVLAFMGVRSLDIYALHFIFLGWRPVLIAPIALSLLVSFVLRLNAVSSMIFFGQASSSWRYVQALIASLRPLVLTQPRT